MSAESSRTTKSSPITARPRPTARKLYSWLERMPKLPKRTMLVAVCESGIGGVEPGWLKTTSALRSARRAHSGRNVPGSVAAPSVSMLTITRARVSGVTPVAPSPSEARVTVSSTRVAGPPFLNDETPVVVTMFSVVTMSPCGSSAESVRMTRIVPVALITLASAVPAVVVSASHTW